MDNPAIIGIFALILIVVFLLSGMWIAVGMAMVGVIICYVLQMGVSIAAFLPWETANSFIMTAIPLFVFMGEIFVCSGCADLVYSGMSKYLAWVPGGLLHSNIGSCAVFAAISGSSVATAATIGTMSLPSLNKRGYDRKMSLGSLAAGGTLGILIPPSITMIVYGSIAEVSVGKLFAGGMVPGILMSLLFMIYIGIRASLNPNLAPREPFKWKDLITGFIDLWPIVVLLVVVLGSIFSGFATPTEGAALGTTAALLMALAMRRLTLKNLRESLFSAVLTTCMLLFIIIGANILGSVLALVGTAKALAALVTTTTLPTFLIILVICLFYIILGCLMEGLAILVITTPVILPSIVALGLDPVWFGVLLVILIEEGLLTPPVGVNLFVIQGISKAPLSDVIAGSMPFFAVQVLTMFLVIIFPAIILWLPNLLFEG